MSSFANQTREVLLQLAFAHLAPHDEAPASLALQIQQLNRPELYGDFLRALPVCRQAQTPGELRAMLADTATELIWVTPSAGLRMEDVARALRAQARPVKIIFQPEEPALCLVS